VATVPWTRNERSAIAGAKSTSYAENVVALAAAHRAGAHEALLPNTVGNLCEGTGSNVVVERDGELLTPPLSAGALAGITRELLLEWAKDDDLPLREADVPISELPLLDGLLLTSSTRDVQPVAELDGRGLPVSVLARRAQRLFAARAAAGMDP
jgi:branched-chain amino acid aminotransferase